jgi:hypothetical protein
VKARGTASTHTLGHRSEAIECASGRFEAVHSCPACQRHREKRPSGRDRSSRKKQYCLPPREVQCRPEGPYFSCKGKADGENPLPIYSQLWSCELGTGKVKSCPISDLNLTPCPYDQLLFDNKKNTRTSVRQSGFLYCRARRAGLDYGVIPFRGSIYAMD